MQKRNTAQKTAIFSELASRCDHPSATRLYEDLKEAGVEDAMQKAGVKDGDSVDIYGIEFDYVY